MNIKPEIIFFFLFGFAIGAVNVLTETYDIDILAIVGEYLDHLSINNLCEQLKDIRYFIRKIIHNSFGETVKNIQYFTEFFKCCENSTELTEVTKFKDSIVINNSFTNELNISDMPNPHTENSIFTTRNLLFFTGSVIMFVGAIFFSGGG